MNKILIVLLSLFSIAHAQRATVTLLQPRMHDAGSNAKSYCNVKDLSDANNPVLDNCPGGATCVEGSVSGKGRCTVFTLKEHQGATAFDYTASRVIRAETQLTAQAAAIACDLTAVPTNQATDEEKWRCIEHAAHLFLGSDEAVADYEASCSVAYKGNIGSKMTSGTLGADGMDDASLASGFASDGASKKLSCHYVPQNNKYLGYAYAEVTFTKKASALGLGEKADKIIKVPMRYVPGNKADAGSVVSGDGHVADPDLTAAHTLLSIPDASADGITGSTSSAGELQITYKLNVMDSRYLINSQSGVEVLNQEAGNFNLIKEGLEIHNDYKNFYDSSKNSFLNSGIAATPIAYASYKAGQCAKTGTSNAGESLDAAGCIATYYDRDFAQYDLSGTYKALYGGLAHWKKGYIGCQLCSNRLAVQGFATQSGGPQVDIAVDIDVTGLQSGCDGSSSNCITLQNIFADPVGAGVEAGKALRLPNCDSDGSSNCGAPNYDPQHADGHVLGEFFTPKVEGTTDYGDYDSEFDFLSTARLIVTDDSKDPAQSGSSGLKIAAACESNGKGKVYTMSSDMLTAANDLFYNKCRIVVKNVEFAKKSHIVFFDSAASATGCSGDASSCSGAVLAEVTQVDGRRILVGDAELSLLRRKLATVDKAGAAITMSISKYTETANQVLQFDIVGTNTMMGYDSNSAQCTGAGAPSADCTEAAVASELTFTSSAVNGEIKEHTIRSSPSCTGFLDVQFRDKDDTFAIYDLRIPCSRTTASAGDEVTLTFDFTLGYDLVENKVTAKAYYWSGMTSEAVTGLAVGSNSGLTQDLTATVSYGQCDASNDILRNNEAGAFTGCDASDNTKGQFADQAGSNHFLSDGLTLDEWSHCAQKVEDDNANDAYIITTKIALKYARKLSYTSGSSATFSESKFCADRKFVTTIRRDSSASVTVATLRAPTLERAVTVTDIAWVACAGANEYKLKISVSSSQKDTTAANTAWAASNLKQILKPTSAGSSDSDNLMIDVGSMTAATPAATFDLLSACVVVTADDCAELCNADGSGCAAQATADDATQSGWSKLSHTETDLVLRGEFTNSDVDSDVNIVTKYVECPLDEANSNTGYLKAGATMQCDNEITSEASTTVASAADDAVGKNNCKQAYTTDSGTAEVKLYISDNDFASSALLTAAEATAATTANWKIRHASIYIERYEKNFDGAKGSLLSSEEFCECGAKATAYDNSVACTEKADRVFGLIPFSTLECGKDTAGVITYDTIRFNFLPLADATNDIFEVKFVLLAENSDLDDVTSRRRRLRSVERRVQLGATSGAAASADPFEVVVPSYNTADEAAQPDAPVQPANATGDSTVDTAHTHDISEGTIWIIIIICIVAVVGVIGIILWGVLSDKGKAARKNVFSGAPAVAEEDEDGNNDNNMWGGRKQRFSNLRY